LGTHMLFRVYRAIPLTSTPRFQFLFFALFSIIGKTSSFVGPFVSSAIIDDSGNNNMPFTFLLGLGVFSVGILVFVDVDKSKRECRKYLEEEAVRVYKMSEVEVLSIGDAGEMDGQRTVVVSEDEKNAAKV
jgi:hypothetical protein